MTQHLFEMPQTTTGPEPVTVRPNVWLLSSDEIPPLLFTCEQAARFLNVGRHRIFDLIRVGELRSVKVGNSRRISARALADYVAALEVTSG
ncbi:excisionase family DNA-binding protein [Nocardioides daphniae]|uniref:Helix-turn-helix domain-containing protein n=2 Tax=Nocardioides daphniae TaxID=402297 RepID=A0ABQ1Q5H2_9ACTN|nr:helix-turn-helix domain-containing protein [Nocardioides daphniae]GGD12666.1 hypothetical protein GCM10007231_09600 [Nocardioides daphniae]